MFTEQNNNIPKEYTSSHIHVCMSHTLKICNKNLCLEQYTKFEVNSINIFSFLFISRIPYYGYTTICLSILLV